MKIATITLNPAIDQTVRVDSFQTNTVNRGQSMQFHAGGKGVNVASFLADSGYSVAVSGFLGQDNAAIFEQFFASKHIDDHFVRLPGQTRTGVKIVDEANGQTTDINMPGLAPSPEAIDKLFHAIELLAADCDWFVMAGALPPDMPVSVYATIITRLKQQGKLTVLDASGEALQQGILAGPTIAKPNIDELQHLVGYPLTNQAEVEQAALQLLDNGSRLVVVSMGEKGALFVDQDAALLAIPPTVHVKSTVGAGDAMVAGLIAGQVQGLSLSACARLATAFALGRITQVGSQLPPPATLQMYFDQVAVQMVTTVPRSA
ncbi:MAG TPA: 1-phosphofructokinase [Ktedonobacteraceae bacterium]|nr:1-phosphofructokinase [Ktedonobacteraceae bacterium]